jgi:hypothetical protein
MTRFTPKLGHDPAYMNDLDPRSQPIPFVMTNADKSEAAVVACHLEAYRRRQNERDAAQQFVPGLVVKRLEPSDLTDEERRSFNL